MCLRSQGYLEKELEAQCKLPKTGPGLSMGICVYVHVRLGEGDQVELAGVDRCLTSEWH